MKTCLRGAAPSGSQVAQPAAARLVQASRGQAGRAGAGLADVLNDGARAVAQRAVVDGIRQSPRVLAQDHAAGPARDARTPVFQRQADPSSAAPESERGPAPSTDAPREPEPVATGGTDEASTQNLVTTPEDDGLMPAEGATPDEETVLPVQARRGAVSAAGDGGDEGSALLGSMAATPTGMPAAVQAKMERAFGTDFSSVRIHEGSAMAAGMGALAATQGDDIHFAAGTYQPGTPAGQQLLGHELAHVVQQRAGRVSALQPKEEAGGVTLNVDRALEAEADDMGGRAARGERAAMPGGGGASRAFGAAVQPMLGFEIEMLVLIDRNGRPLPEKTIAGQVGAHLNIDVDHGPAVDAPAPTAAADARYDVDTVTPGAEIEMLRNGGPADPRPALQQLDLATWQNTTNTAVFTRPASTVHPHVNNAALQTIDVALQAYNFNHKNWEAARAAANLTTILGQTQAWLNANTNKPNKVFHPHRRARWRSVRNAVRDLRLRAQAHNVFWTNPLHANPPGNLVRGFRPNALAPWAPYQPDAGMGTDRYASIVEVVTNAYPPETAAGRANILQAIQDAVQFATNIEAAAGANGTTRVALNTIANTAGVLAGVHIGNPAQPNQTTAGSIQATGALDLAQFPSYVLSMTARNPQDGHAPSNPVFNLKHHSDDDDSEGDRVRAELPQAVADATAAVNAIKVGIGAPDLQNLRGLVVLICQYLRMGRHFFGHNGALDKNIVPFLSRTDLSQVYARLVPTAEKTWLAGGGRLATLQAQILARTNRAGASAVFNDLAESDPGGGLSCQAFVQNVFAAGADGITGNLGGFRAMNTESVDPAGNRGGDWRSPAAHPGSHLAAPNREGFVFEMRNMARRESFGGGRFPKSQWLKLAEQQVAVFAALNARAEASATQDQRVRHAGYGLPGGAHRLDTVSHTDAAW